MNEGSENCTNVRLGKVVVKATCATVTVTETPGGDGGGVGGAGEGGAGGGEGRGGVWLVGTARL